MKCHIKKTCIWIQSNVSHSGQIVKPFIFFSSISSFPIPLTSSLSKLGLCDLMVFLPLVSFKLFHPSLQDKLSKNIALITPWAMCAKSFQSCLTLSDLMDCSPAGSSVYGSLQVRILEWVAMPFSRGSSQPKDWTQVSHIAGRFFTVWAIRETQSGLLWIKLLLLSDKGHKATSKHI